MKQEYEIISHEELNYKLFLVDILYRMPHFHKDFEVCLILRGNVILTVSNRKFQLEQGDFFVVEPFVSHALKADEAVTIVSLQVPPIFFSSYYPQMDHIEFFSPLFPKENEEEYRTLYHMFLSLACAYLEKKKYFEFTCASMINAIFAILLNNMQFRFVSEKEKGAYRTKAVRMRRIVRYIDEGYSEKLLLSEIAKKEQLSLAYLSHFFKDCFSISFQDYLMKIRCEKARQLLLLTQHSLLDICISCGFSDAKYFNGGFKKQYGCTPKEYRINFRLDQLEQQQHSILTTQEFLSAEASLVLLHRCLKNVDFS